MTEGKGRPPLSPADRARLEKEFKATQLELDNRRGGYARAASDSRRSASDRVKSARTAGFLREMGEEYKNALQPRTKNELRAAGYRRIPFRPGSERFEAYCKMRGLSEEEVLIDEKGKAWGPPYVVDMH